MGTQVPARPKQKLGQHFLVDSNILNKIVQYFDPQPYDNVIEIGAGTGALTSRLAPRVKRLIAVEIDKNLIPHLQQIPGIEIVHADFRKLNLSTFGSDLRIIGNLPYYLSTPILIFLLQQRKYLKDMLLMFQEEVTQRILSPPSHHEYGLLSVLAQYYCIIEKGFRISKNCFHPRPKIESRVLKFLFRPEPGLPFEQYAPLLVAAFSQRRKKLRSNLLRSFPLPPDQLDQIFHELNISLDARAENLNPDTYEKLAQRILIIRNAGSDQP